ncbi:hypothetical protein HDA40_001663 [Hamadaea flava]|uniref:Uncharacterized protein n=1 Tax=Hamadaea flava TaxID=1742688 RepID=A0ABV8LN97_9ACTN|nr:hypothetical protein [Hamadaea flava]MCP2323156.1 hypothetical protein [Hamadaea flava]
MRFSRAVISRPRRHAARWLTVAIAAALAIVSTTASPGAARPKSPTGTTVVAPSIVGYPPVAAPQTPAPNPLPKKGGSVKLDKSARVSPKAGASTLATPATAKVALRALVVATTSDDFGVPTWTSTLDQVGAAYDVLYTATTPLAGTTLVRPDGTGKYNAILLTSTMLLYSDGGGYTAGLTGDEWNLLWAYERDYGVRQVSLYGSYGSWPEDYCLRARTEGSVGDTALTATLTTDGAAALDYLNPAANIPILQSYVYRNQLAAGCAAQPVLQIGSDVVGVRSTSTDGRERMTLTFTSNQYLLQARLLTYGLFRWASKDLFLGDQRHYLNIDVDDWFNTSDEMLPNGQLNSDPGYQMSGHDAYNAYLRQTGLRSSYPLASQLTFGMAINGGDANLTAASQCYPTGGINRLTSTTRCLRNNFRWINHTLTHPKMNSTPYATNVAEISQNLTVAQRLGLPVDRTVLKTPEYSGLGVYNPDATNDVDPPTDFGLNASNPDLLRAATDLGVKYLHGNMSFPSHQPPCFNCVIAHPMAPNLSIVPDWPTNIAYFSTTPDEETYFYNSFYGPNGKFPYWSTNLTYSQIIAYETDQALLRLAAGSSYTTTFHIGNLRDYGSGQTLLTDWAQQLLAKYSSYYSVPVLSPGWPALAAYAQARTAHFAQLRAGVDAVYDAATVTVTLTSPTAGTLTLCGAQTAGATTYGNDVSAQLTLAANTPLTVSMRPRL